MLLMPSESNRLFTPTSRAGSTHPTSNGTWMTMVHTDATQVKTGVSRLSDQELARLAARAQKADADFAAGSISDRDLLIILVAVLVLVVIILAAEH